MTLNELLDKLEALSALTVTKGPKQSRLIEYDYPWNGQVLLFLGAVGDVKRAVGEGYPITIVHDRERKIVFL